MSQEDQGFTVKDRRIFSEDGASHESQPQEPAGQPAPPQEEPEAPPQGEPAPRFELRLRADALSRAPAPAFVARPRPDRRMFR